ncbi:MAG: FKBP-type peptidyl-prolyl cis-trans isomerase [Cytophagales bacterium]|nr:FKBP-type peptidyl-prolyl cis-trans isomerase [Cytophagales bacterium]
MTGLLLLQGCLMNDDIGQQDEARRAENEQLINQYVAANNLQVQTSASGLRYRIFPASTSGATPKLGDQIVLSYIGRLTNRTLFDSALNNRNSFIRFPFRVNAALPGIDEVVGYMKEGDSAVALMPFYLAFGSEPAYGGKVPGYSPIVFETRLVDIQTEDEALQDYIARRKFPADSVVKTTSGLYYYFTKRNPTGTAVSGRSTGRMLYKGMFVNGSVFDQTQNNQAADFNVNGVIAGFKEGLNLMRAGEKIVLMMPSGIGYGTQGRGSIPPYAPLVFELEVVSVN